MSVKKGITFVIPSINRPTIHRAIDSLIRQSNPNWECVIVYDGVDGPSFNDERIRCLKVEKIGTRDDVHGMAGLVRNFGIKAVDTEWVGFLDDDDSLDESYVDVLLNKYEGHDAVVFRMRYIDGSIIPRVEDSRMYFSNVGISFCYKRKDFPILFDSNRNGEDFDMVNRLQSLCERFIVAEEILYRVNH